MGLARKLARVVLGVLIALGLVLWAVALLLFSQIAEPSDDFARIARPLIIINLIGLTVLLALIAQRLIRLVRDYRRFVPGSRLQARVFSLVVIVAAVPLVVLYMFSVTFITKDIDEWFPIDIAGTLEQTVELSLETVGMLNESHLARLGLLAEELGQTASGNVAGMLDESRRTAGAAEVALYAADGRRLRVSVDDGGASAPDRLDAATLAQLAEPGGYAGTELRDGDYEVLAAVPVPGTRGSEILWARFPLPGDVNARMNEVLDRQGNLANLEGAKTDLELMFLTVQSLVLLVAVLAAVYAAFFVAQRLISPIQQLMQGTRAVARGDFETKVPAGQRDEIGFLVNSFNNMTQRLALARQEAYDSEQRLEDERNKLEVILARLSTGVVSLGPDLTIRTANKAAGDILGVDLEAHIGESLVELAESKPLLKAFLDISARHLNAGRSEWREQITLKGDLGNRELVCACTELATEDEHGLGYIVVLDDITVLMQAQREAAWGEVARRLAHEIKNPLTPIQLSAERVRRRYLRERTDDLDLLDRATYTIIQQVDAMKGMVDAFSEYARAPDIELGSLDVNDVINEVTELYRHQVPPVAISMNLDASLPDIEADIGRLRQIMHNLIRNASEAIEDQEDAEIEITTRRRELKNGPHVEIIVSDNGPGFAADIIDQAFLPYVTSKDKGTGLGLAIVRKLVEEHGGTIRAGNKAQRGAEVSILLPVQGAGRSTGAERARQRRKRA